MANDQEFKEFRVRVGIPTPNMPISAASIHQSLRSAGDRLRPEHTIEVVAVDAVPAG